MSVQCKILLKSQHVHKYFLSGFLIGKRDLLRPRETNSTGDIPDGQVGSNDIRRESSEEEDKEREREERETVNAPCVTHVAPFGSSLLFCRLCYSTQPTVRPVVPSVPPCNRHPGLSLSLSVEKKTGNIQKNRVRREKRGRLSIFRFN